MHQLKLINLLLSDLDASPQFNKNITAPTQTQLQELYKRVKLPFAAYFTGEFRKPKAGDYYIWFSSDPSDNGAIHFSVKCAVADIDSECLIIRLLSFDARVNNVFNLDQCMNEDGGEAYYKGEAVKLLSSHVDANLKVAVLRGKFICVLDLMDLTNKQQHQLSIKMRQEDAEFNHYTKWKIAT